MPLPATVDARLSWPAGRNSHLGPFEVGGNLYVLGVDATNALLRAYKSTDGGNTWAEQNSANARGLGGNASEKTAAACLDGTDIAAVLVPTTNGALQLVKFNTTTDMWSTTVSSSGTSVGRDVSLSNMYSIVARGADNYVVAYQSLTESIMGTAYRRVTVRACTAGTWSTAVALETGVQEHQDLAGLALGSSSRGHVLWTAGTQVRLRQRSFLSGNTLGTAGDVVPTGSSNQVSVGGAAGHPFSYVDGADTKVAVLYEDASTPSRLRVGRFTSADTPNTMTSQAVSAIEPKVPTSAGPANAGSLAADGTTLHGFFADEATADLWRTSDGGTGTWTAAVEHRDAVTIGGVNIAKIAIGIGILYDDGGAVKFDTHALGTAFARTGTDSITVSDSASAVTSPGAPTITSVTPGDGSATVAFAAPASNGGSAIIEYEVLEEVVVASFTRTGTDSFSVSDTASRATVSRTRTSTDTVTRSDAATRAVLARARSAQESATTVSDNASGVRGQVRSATDSITRSDSATRATYARTRTGSDTVAMSDAATRAARANTRTAADSFAISDASSRAAYTRTRTSSDSITISDSAVGVFKASGVDADDSFSISDSATRTSVRTSVFANDSVSTSDAATKTSSNARTSSDSWSISDSTSRVRSSSRSASDTTTLSDAASRAAFARIRTASDSISSSDVAARTSFRNRTAGDSVTFSDNASRTGTFARFSNDTVIISDLAVGEFYEAGQVDNSFILNVKLRVNEPGAYKLIVNEPGSLRTIIDYYPDKLVVDEPGPIKFVIDGDTR